jgi:hypothetical protein
MSEVTLFVRKASGLVRSWSVFDAFIYATFSINLITLGLFIFSYCYYFEGNLATAVVVGGLFTIFEVIVYASLISAMPRAGGDYSGRAAFWGADGGSSWQSPAGGSSLAVRRSTGKCSTMSSSPILGILASRRRQVHH